MAWRGLAPAAAKFYGKALDAVAALPVEDILNYKHVKAAILRAYELVPEAYRQKFRNYEKMWWANVCRVHKGKREPYLISNARPLKLKIINL